VMPGDPISRHHDHHPALEEQWPDGRPYAYVLSL